MDALARLVDELRGDGVALVVARMRASLKDLIDAAGLDAQIGAQHFYPTVRAAVQACVRQEATRGPPQAAETGTARPQ